MGTSMVIVILSQVVSLVLCMQTPCNIRYNKKLEGLVAYCYSRGLTSVPQDLPDSIVALHLDDNNITTKLTNGVFASYPSLTSLTLSFNAIEALEINAFLGLNHLVELVLVNTTFLDNGSYPQGIFDPLRNLQTLHLGGFVRDRFEFPCFIFLPLKNLTMLYLDGFPWHYLEKCMEIRTLTNLKTINSSASWSNVLNNDSFINLKFVPLENLIVSGSLYFTGDCLFCPLKDLKSLHIGSNMHNDIGLKNVTMYLSGLTSLYEIDLHQVQNKESSNIDIVLDRQVMGYLPQICVKRLDLSNNRFTILKNDTFQSSDTLTACIENLDLSRNYINFGLNIYLPVMFMENLKLLDLSQSVNRFSPRSDSCPVGSSQSEDRQLTKLGAVEPLPVPLPPKLEHLNLRKVRNEMFCDFSIAFTGGENLRTLDISDNMVLYIDAYVKGLSNISYLDISGMDISENTFENADMFKNVEKLIARQTRINPSALMTKYSVFVLTMTKLKYLDLSDNHLSYIPLELLNLPSLISLDISCNSINIIKKGERELLDMKRDKQGSFHLNIFGNSIACTCHTLDFVQWLHESRISFGNKGNYSCLTDYGTMTYTTNFYKDILLHWRQCVGQFWLAVTVSLQLLIIMCLMSAFLLKKYFPKVEYQILRWLGRLDAKRWDYEYDAYICYGDKDYQWPCLCLYKELLEKDDKINLYLPDLHDPFGEVKAEVIHAAIKMSWKLIIFVTEDLFADEWSYFKVLEALRLFSQEGVITNSIILLYQNMSPENEARVPKVLLNVVPRKNILQVIPGNDFWMDLRCMIVTEDMNMDILF